MGRKYIRKTQRGSYGSAAIQQALSRVRNGAPLKSAAREFAVPAKTLRRHLRGHVTTPGLVKLGRKPVLSWQHEDALVDHIKAREKALFGLNTEDVRKLAYSLAVELNISNFPFNKHSKSARLEWLSCFLSRHPNLFIRSPQATSIARAVGFKQAQSGAVLHNSQRGPE